MTTLAELTQGLSGSDLREMCRNAAMVPVREFVRDTKGDKGLLELGQLQVRFRPVCYHSLRSVDTAPQGFRLRPLSLSDFLANDATSALPPSSSAPPAAPPLPVYDRGDRSRLDEMD